MNYFHLKSKHTKIKGFTLVEMLVVLGLFSFIMTLATGVLYTTQSINVKLQGVQVVLDNVNVSMDIMTRDIRYGTNFHCGGGQTSSQIEQETEISLRKDCAYQTTGLEHGGKFLFFKPIDAVNDADRVAYYASTTASGSVILKDEYIKNETTGLTSTTTYQITADDVKIKSLIFYVVGANTTGGANTVSGVGDLIQPIITVTLAGETIPIARNASSTKFTIQSSISSRVLDN